MDGKEFVFDTSSIKPDKTRKRKYNNNSKTKNGVVQMKQEPPSTPTKKTKTKTGNSKKNNNKSKETHSKSMNIRNYFGKVSSNQPLSPSSKSAIDFTDKTDRICLSTTAVSSNTSKINSKQNDRNSTGNTSHNIDSRRHKDTIKNVSKPLTTLVEDSSSTETESESENDQDTTLIKSRGLIPSPISSVQESPLKQYEPPLLNSSCFRNNNDDESTLNHETSLTTGTRSLSLSLNLSLIHI